jgi:hypothetical protein
MIRRASFIFIVCATLASASTAQTLPSTQPSPVVGIVLGRPITAVDVALELPVDTTTPFDSRDLQKWEAMTRVMSAFGKPIIERFKTEQKIDATPADIEAFQAAMLASQARTLETYRTQLAAAKLKLESPDLKSEERTAAEKTKALYEQVLSSLGAASDRAVPDSFARSMIVAGKTERELHRRYGGQIIFQQFGREALDARRRLYEAAEASGDLAFNDPGVRYLFYYYFNMRHPGGRRDSIPQSDWYFGSAATQPSTQPSSP